MQTIASPGIKTIGEIQSTKNYDLFQDVLGNRKMCPHNLNRIRVSMLIKPLMSPILVNEFFQVIDGQHRLAIWKEMNLPVYFITVEGYGINEVHQMNENMKHWNLFDFVNSYADQGIEDYILFRDFLKKYGFAVRETLALLVGENKKYAERDLKRGDLKIVDSANAFKLADQIVEVGQYYKQYQRRTFINTMRHLFNHKDYNHSFFVHQLSKQPSALTNCFTIKNYLLIIEDIYNFQTRDKVRFY